jgi:hypothetical protein
MIWPRDAPSAVAPNEFDRFAHGGTRADHVVDDHHATAQRCADDRSTFTVILRFLAVEAVRQIVPLGG